MTNWQLRELVKGDKVEWNDPDMDVDCSRTDFIEDIELPDDAEEYDPDATDLMATIVWPDESVAVAFAHELERVG